MKFQPLDNEQIILRKLAAGEEYAFRQLYHHYADRVYSMAILHLKRIDLAEDLVQSIFLTIWESRQQLANVEAFAGWLHTLTRNTIISTLRKQGTQANYLNFLKQRMELAGEQPEAGLLHKERQHLMREAIGQLSAQQQKALLLQHEEGLSYAQIGQRMGISPNTVRVHLYKAMESLRRFMLAHRGNASLLAAIFFLIDQRKNG